MVSGLAERGMGRPRLSRGRYSDVAPGDAWRLKSRRDVPIVLPVATTRVDVGDVLRLLLLCAVVLGATQTFARADGSVATQTLQIIIEPALLVSLGAPSAPAASLSFALDVPSAEATSQTQAVPLTCHSFARGGSQAQVAVALDSPLPAHMSLRVSDPARGAGGEVTLVSGPSTRLPEALGGRGLAFALVADQGAVAGTVMRTMTVTVTE